jgi:hypothetical protein
VTTSQSDCEQVFVILRADLFHSADASIETTITAKEIVRSLDLAEREVARLNALHADRRVRYWVSPSRLFPPGRSASSYGQPA